MSGNLAPPDRAEFLTYLRKVKSQTDGGCDSCRIAATLWRVAPDVTNDALFDWLTFLHDRTVRLFAHPVVRENLDRLARELQQRRSLTGDEIAKVVDASALQAAYAEMKYL